MFYYLFIHLVLCILQVEVAKKHSVMFTKCPPRRLQQDMFEGSCKSPMKEIYTRHAEALKDIVGGKVTKVIKWKIRKMRANPLPAKSCQSDNFNFEALAGRLKRERFVYSTPRKTPSATQSITPSATPLRSKTQNPTGDPIAK